MRRFLIALSLTAFTVGVEATVSTPCAHTSLMRIYVRPVESIQATIVTPLVFAGEYTIVPGGSSILTIAIKRSCTPSTEVRTARNEFDVPIVANTTYQLESDIILEN